MSSFKRTLRSAKDYQIELSSKKERAMKVLATLRYRKHQPAVEAQLEALYTIISSIRT
jgi:hypothetical protein